MKFVVKNSKPELKGRIFSCILRKLRKPDHVMVIRHLLLARGAIECLRGVLCTAGAGREREGEVNTPDIRHPKNRRCPIMSDKCPLSCKMYSRSIRLSRDVAWLKRIFCPFSHLMLPASHDGRDREDHGTGSSPIPPAQSMHSP